ncbi:MAG: PQQ-dependent sugar dehydrogenase [Bacteroidetes bacterium]|nr:PQQ-dependent sugar dehydrogenase [Bacteroidota bacterium]
MQHPTSSFILAVLLLSGPISQAQGTLFDYSPASSQPEGGPSLPSGFYLESITPGISFEEPVAVVALVDGRFLVAEKRGIVHTIENGIRLPTPFLDIQDEVLNHADRGLLGLTLDPEFASNGRIFLHYAVDHDGTGDYERFDAFVRITSYTASAANPNVADLSSRNVLIGETFSTGIPACFFSHNGGHLAFGSDGTLLVSTGDAASFIEVDAGGLYPDCFGPGRFDSSEDIGSFRSLRVESLAGKILRIDPNTGDGITSNPFYTGDPTDNASRVWAYGLRNAFRFAVRDNGSTDPNDGLPGSVYIGDVGWNRWEEQQVAKSGENFAWPCYEGPFEHSGYQAETPATNGCGVMPPRTDPAYYWSHTDPGASNPPGLLGFTALGGAFYTGSVYPAVYQNAYFYADFALGWMAFAHVDADDNFLDHTLFAENLSFPVHISYDPFREQFLLVDVAEGDIFWLEFDDPDTNEAPVAVASATPTNGTVPLAVAFFGDESFDPEGRPLLFSWDFGDGAAATEPNPSHVYDKPGLYPVTLTVTDPSGLTGTANLTITVGSGNGPPEAAITEPAKLFAAAPGDEVVLVALASDPDQDAATLAYHWSVSQVHNSHEHPNFLEADGQSVTFTVPGHGVSGEVIYYHIYLTVADDEGLTATDERLLRIVLDDEFDVTDAGAPIALVSQLPGGSTEGIEVIQDGFFPPVGTEPLGQFDTYTNDTGSGRTEDWIGYEFSEQLQFSRITFQEGLHFNNGGWFETLKVEVRSGGTWTETQFFTPFPEYRGNDGVSYNTYELHFRVLEGDAIRISGAPGGSARFISVGELRVFSLTPLPDAIPGPNALTIDRIYPNPFNATTSVRLNTVEPGFHHIEVYDLLGRLVLRNSAFSLGEETLNVVVDLSGLAGGSYLVRAVGPGSAITRTHRISLLR